MKGNIKMKMLYARVSTSNQNTDRQLINQDQYDMVFIDKQSGKDKNRPQLNTMLCSIRKDDIIEVHSLDRLGRNVRDLLEIIEIIKDKGATIHFKKEGLTFEPDNKNNNVSKIILVVMGAVAEMERENILERQREGIEIAKKKGVYNKAHPTKRNKVDIESIKYDRQCGMTETELMNKYHISKPTLYRYLKK